MIRIAACRAAADFLGMQGNIECLREARERALTSRTSAAVVYACWQVDVLYVLIFMHHQLCTVTFPHPRVHRVNYELGLHIHKSVVTTATKKANTFHPMDCHSILMDGTRGEVERKGKRVREEVESEGDKVIGTRIM